MVGGMGGSSPGWGRVGRGVMKLCCKSCDACLQKRCKVCVALNRYKILFFVLIKRLCKQNGSSRFRGYTAVIRSI